MGYKIIADDGTELDSVPDELIENHPKYKSVLNEAIERKHKIRELQEAKEKPAAPVEPVKTEAAPMDTDAIVSRAVEAALQAISQKQSAQTAHQQTVDVLVAEFKLKPDAREAIAQFTDEKQMRSIATALAKAGLVFQDTPLNGNGNTEVTLDEKEEATKESVSKIRGILKLK